MTESDELIRLRARVAELEVQLDPGCTAAARARRTDEAGAVRPATRGGCSRPADTGLRPRPAVRRVGVGEHVHVRHRPVRRDGGSAGRRPGGAGVRGRRGHCGDTRAARRRASCPRTRSTPSPTSLGCRTRVADVLPALSVPLANGVSGFVGDQVATIIRSDQFATVWAQANRVAHEQLVKLLSGNAGGVVTAEDGAVSLQLGPIIAQVKDRLVAEGFALADNIPEIDRSFVLVQSDGDHPRPRALPADGHSRDVVAPGDAGPLRRRRGTGSRSPSRTHARRDRHRGLHGGPRSPAGCRTDLLPERPPARGPERRVRWQRLRHARGLPPDRPPRYRSARARRCLRCLRRGFVAGGRLVRAQAARLIGVAGRGADAAGMQPGPVSSWVRAHKRPLEIGVVAAGALSLTFWDRPSAGDVLVIALLVLLGVGVVELMARPAAQARAGSAALGEPVPIVPQAGPPTADTIAPATPGPVAPAATSTPR